VNDHALVVFDHLELDPNGVADRDAVNGRGPRLAEVERVAGACVSSQFEAAVMAA
jgi:hypothetical protein